MKNIQLVAILFAAAIAAGCATPATTGQQSSTQTRPPQQAPVGDGAVTARVQAAIAADPQLAPAKINVKTNEGRVTLTGEIKSMDLRKKVESIVRGTEGARSVDNQLIITG